MQLGDILDDLPLDLVTSSLEINQVDTDSRLCVPGSLFFALSGNTTSGVKFAKDAVTNGAVCVVASERITLDVPVVLVPASQLRALSAYASATVVRHPETKTQLVGVTGTNGKTTVTTLVGALARALSWNGANIGTLTSERTTPASPELFRTLASLVESFDPAIPKSVIALEVSSHAIVQGRVDGLGFTVVAFTNLGHDHLDYHSTMEEYFAAKSHLFTSEFAQRAVIWVDDPYGERLAASTTLPVIEVARADASEIATSLSGTTFFWRGHLVNSTLVGDFNVDNALIAMTILSVLGAEDGAISSAMSDVNPVPGRFDVLRGRGVTVIVDYAHTPDGLRRLLLDVRAMVPNGRVITVFGCGGDRDRAKRPEMGAIASSLSDLTIVTSDNPRSESPDAIIDAIMSGVLSSATVYRQSDRRLAIAQAGESAVTGDVVVLAGKGHESTQIIGDLTLPFDDHVVAEEVLR
jgi:UDP-N-acetylmuramoyl-L-alanyl-D-glutamate--2,6-diaminopimelate ligase